MEATSTPNAPATDHRDNVGVPTSRRYTVRPYITAKGKSTRFFGLYAEDAGAAPHLLSVTVYKKGAETIAALLASMKADGEARMAGGVVARYEHAELENTQLIHCRGTK